jgi:predicted TIM-barrel enzyme
MDAENIGQFLPVADGFIVGSCFKQGGRWDRPVDAARVRAFMKKARA